MKKYLSFRKGFTLIELLVVIAVLGVLATAIVAVINPLEKIAKAKDSTRKAQVSTLSNALQSYYTLKNGVYPTPSNTWITDLVTNGDLKSVPPPVPTITPSCQYQQNGYCYISPAANVVRVYTPLSTSERPTGTSGTTPYSLWDSATGESGTVYSSSGTTPDSSPLPIVFGPGSASTQNLVGWWKMNETTGATTAIDSSGNGNNGTVINGANSNGTAYIFNGSTQYITVAASSTVDLYSAFSVSAWMNPTTTMPDQGGYIGTYGGNYLGYHLNFDSSQKPGLVVGGGDPCCGGSNNVNVQSGSTITTGAWHHIVGTFDGVNARIYVDGVLKNTAAAVGATYSGQLLVIGKQAWSGHYFTGSIDDVRVYNRALSASEVSNLFSADRQ